MKSDYWNGEEKLLGSEVSSVVVALGGHRITVTFKDGRHVVLDAVGECCSSSFFEETDSLPDLVGHTITSVTSVESEPPDGGADNDYYVHKWRYYEFHHTGPFSPTRVGFRNISNGYYDGHMEASDAG